MPRQDIYRYVLLIAIGLCGFFIMQAWIADYGNRPVEAGTEEPMSEPIAPTGEPVAGAPTDIPTPQTDSVPSDGVAPDSSLIQSLPSDGSISSDPTRVSDESALITVTTPLLKVWIDRNGGDIVRVHLLDHPVDIDHPDIPTTMLDRSPARYYVAESGLVGQDGLDASGTRPVFRSSRSSWAINEGTHDVLLRTERDGIEVEKIFTFTAESYLVEVNQIVKNGTSNEFRANVYGQLTRDGKPLESTGGFLGPRPYVGGALTTEETQYKKIDFEDLEESGRNAMRFPEVGGWIAILQHYFLSAWVAPDDQQYLYYAYQDSNRNYRYGMTGPAVVVPPNGSAEFPLRFYVGPKDQDVLESISEHLNLTVDYGFLWWLAVPMFLLLELCYNIVGNWGFAIIVLTAIIKLLLFPLSAMSYKSMAKMRQVAPKFKKIQERFGSDRMRMSEELRKLYQKEKVNPAAGCLPMLLQIPVFIALYWVLYESVELRQAPFMLWIRDLSIMDPWFVLPILMGGSMFLMMRLNPPMPDPMQQRIMQFMPVVMTVLFVFFPAGLVLYWLTNNVLSFAQQYYTTKKFDKDNPVAKQN